ncbi:flagellar hook-basal body complex protein [Romboutsia maritimum]|uniref:Flagellar hook protein FlgE n=1 Tax=Romboutsia maritimum TaxID=2020948 RepID=A0A371IVM0_9FIRM|nr:flagellar hook-basal body complex protein [Romboutsia maritimum]RDY24537.1 flagellar hook-basal body complex protein [Romboutsia maritimum]
MLRSMYSGISGMKSNQTRMDVVGNNVANASTTAYKKSSARFTDTLYQNSIYASAPSGGIGGVNPGQVGLGVKVAGINKNMIQGSMQTTGNNTDFAIDGDGYFTIDKGKTGAPEIVYTRDGSFSIDTNGDLVTANGYHVVDSTGAQINIPNEHPKGSTDPKKKVTSFTVSKDGSVSLALADGTKADNTSGFNVKLGIAVFKNPAGLEALSGNLYGVTGNSGAPIANAKYGNVNQGAIEMSNVDLSEEFTEMIVTTRAFQASSKVITTSDEILQEIINLKR